jgi:hypothetical protein
VSPLVCVEALHHDWEPLGVDDRGQRLVECSHCHEIAIE